MLREKVVTKLNLSKSYSPFHTKYVNVLAHFSKEVLDMSAIFHTVSAFAIFQFVTSLVLEQTVCG